MDKWVWVDDDKPPAELNLSSSSLEPKPTTARERFETRLTKEEKEYVCSFDMPGAEFVRHLIQNSMKEDKRLSDVVRPTIII